jgi:hypothetical protein
VLQYLLCRKNFGRAFATLLFCLPLVMAKRASQICRLSDMSDSSDWEHDWLMVKIQLSQNLDRLSFFYYHLVCYQSLITSHIWFQIYSKYFVQFLAIFVAKFLATKHVLNSVYWEDRLRKQIFKHNKWVLQRIDKTLYPLYTWTQSHSEHVFLTYFSLFICIYLLCR